MDKNLLVKIIGYPATIIHGDPAVYDRWIWLKRNLNSGKIRTLDAGCGSGAFTMYAAKRGNEAVGISFDERNNKAAADRAALLGIKNVRFVTGNLGDLDSIRQDLGLFDQVICFETIEHILEDQKLVSGISGILKPGGRLLLTTPYKYYAKGLVGDDKAKLSTYEDGGHVRWGYTHEEMEKIFNKAGLVMEKKEYTSGIISKFIIALHRFVQRKMNYKIAWVVIFPFRIFTILDPIVMKVFKFPYLSVAVIGRKKI